ncbi:PolC-type DNA polymerase III [Streptosporangium sp. NPDC087985]|uniref:3'-5' exonuclease n=1 Tax=Streptosporangium sp. NPDC087985 TaxID=3366196 RepID=UPI00382FC4B0
MLDGSPGYLVIDLETTGLHPSRHDRIVEIGIVHLDPAGQVTGEWSTLVNPGRDLGSQHVHGINAADVRYAPTFNGIAATLTTLHLAM